MDNKRVLVTGPFDDGLMEALKRAGFDIVSLEANASDEELSDALSDAEAYVLGGNEMLTKKLLQNADMLKMIIFLGEQPQTFMEPGLEEVLKDRGIRIESTPGVSTTAVAEMACALILCALRRIPYIMYGTWSCLWPSVTGDELTGDILGIYGMGKIGYGVAKRMQGFDLDKVLYSDIVRSEAAETDFGAEKVELDRLFSESDVVSIHAPLTPKTEGIIGEDFLRRMKPTAVLVNTARAAIVDPTALKKALDEGRPACAAFDGYYVEGPMFASIGPGEDQYGLLEMKDRFFLTSHQGFNTRNAIRKASEMASNYLMSYFAAGLEAKKAA